MNLKTLLNKIEKVSANYSAKFNIPRNNLWYLLKVQEEMGELTQAYLSMNGQGRHKNKTAEEMRQDFENEIADVLCHVLLLAKSENIDLKKAVGTKWLNRLKMTPKED